MFHTPAHKQADPGKKPGQTNSRGTLRGCVLRAEDRSGVNTASDENHVNADGEIIGQRRPASYEPVPVWMDHPHGCLFVSALCA